ncbi:AAA family ATPase [Nocardiopsis quinghaiensis]|uniref:AAA family ATPase n=1 Tax=Nocardiopsis quinghaiensis TaxID=464995 RepID=UPI00123A0671|nr:AAA family ATPase [Nocardiopsis quinghaiensis]
MSTRFLIRALEVATDRWHTPRRREPHRREFDEGLNLLIGPPGSGKSTVIELIRFGLGMNARKTPVVEKVRGVHVEITVGERLLRLYRSTVSHGEVRAHDMSLGRDIGTFPVTSNDPDETTIGKQLMVWLGLPSDVDFTSGGQRRTLSFEHVWEYVHVPQTDIDQRIARHDATGLTPRRMRLFQLLFDLIDEELQQLEQLLLEARKEHTEAKNRNEGVTAFTERASLPPAADLRGRLSEALQRRERLSGALSELRSTMGTRDDRVLTLRGMLAANRNNALRTQAALRELTQVQASRQEHANGLRRSLERLQRLRSANDLLAPIEFSQCPRCMQDVDGRSTPAETCRLCLQPEPPTEEEAREKSSSDGELPLLIPGESGAQEVQLAAQREELLSLISQGERERQTLLGHLDELAEGNREIREEEELLTGTGGPHVEELSRLTEGLARVDGEVEQLRHSLDLDRQVQSFRDDVERAGLEARAAQENKKGHEAYLRRQAQGLFARLSRSYDRLLHDLGTPNALRGEISPKDYLPHIDEKRFDSVNLSGGNQIPFIVGYWLTLHEEALGNPLYLLPGCLILDSPQKSLGPLQPLSQRLYEQFRRITANSERPFQLFVLDTDLPDGFDPGSSLISVDYPSPGIPGIHHAGPENQPHVEDMEGMEDW